jgi:hypothetical protein
MMNGSSSALTVSKQTVNSRIFDSISVLWARKVWFPQTEEYDHDTF